MDVISRVLENTKGIGNRDIFIGSLLADLYMKYDGDDIDAFVQKAVKISNESIEKLVKDIGNHLKED